LPPTSNGYAEWHHGYGKWSAAWRENTIVYHSRKRFFAVAITINPCILPAATQIIRQ
jgi:hypothetical protein